MTRDEHRAKCINEMAFRSGIDYDEAEVAFDSLHGLARVVPIEATEEMIKAGMAVLVPTMQPIVAEEVFHAMVAAGDLSNGPETNADR